MTLRKMTTAALAAAGMLILILDGKTALAGAGAGMELCLKTVIPALFPFLFLCSILTGSLWGGHFPWLRLPGRLLGIPEGAESLLIPAVLGGYPAGAQAIGENYRANRLSKEDALHLLTFCSNAGPSFLFGMVALQFPDRQMIWSLWVIQILAAAMTGCIGHTANPRKTVLAGKTDSISAALTRSVRSMGIICGWVLLFRIFIEFLSQWLLWRFPREVQILIIGLLELSNGCCILSEVQDISLRFVLCSLFLSFGGLCVTMQTASVIGDLPLRSYLLGKVTQTAISLILSFLCLRFGWGPMLLTGVFAFLFLHQTEKRGRFPLISGV